MIKPFQLKPEFEEIIKNSIALYGSGQNAWDSSELEKLRSAIRNHYRQEQNGLCAYCKNELSLQSAANAQIEHILSKSKYGNFVFEVLNLCVICADCNQIKSDKEAAASMEEITVNEVKSRYPRASSSFIIVHPHFDDWGEHIKKIDKFYIDLTKKGNATIGICRLNRYVQQFGVSDETFDDFKLNSMCQSILDTKNPLEKANRLDKLFAIVMQDKWMNS